MMLPFDAVVDGHALDAPRISVLAVTRTVGFREFERAGFAPFVHCRLTGTWVRAIVRGRRVRASGDESRTSQDDPFDVRSRRGNCPSTLQFSAHWGGAHEVTCANYSSGCCQSQGRLVKRAISAPVQLPARTPRSAEAAPSPPSGSPGPTR
jgi:hypothetical protein